MKTRLSIAVVIALCTTGICRATIEFSAYIQNAKESKFVITDTEEKTSSGWIAIGQSFKGHTLVSFDPKKEVLSVKKGDVTLELRLKDSRVKEGGAGSPEVVAKLTAAKTELARLRTRYTDKHPVVVEQLKTIAELESQLKK